MNTPLRHALVAIAATAVTLAPTAAFAQSYSHTDGKGDVQSLDVDNGSTTPAPTVTEGDVLSSTIAYNARKVLVTVHFAQLSAASDAFEQVVSVKTSSGRVRDLIIVAGPGFRGGKAATRTGQGKKWRCATQHSIDYTHATLTAAIPRRCLGNPRALQVGLGTLTSKSQKYYIDDAQSAGVGNDIAYGPRIHRG